MHNNQQNESANTAVNREVNKVASGDEQAVSEFKSKSGVKRIFSAFFYSLDGLKSAWRYEHAFRQELLLVSVFQKLIMIAVLVLMLIVELLNSAIEAVVDRVSLERHALSKNAKDYGSAAVLLSFLIALATWSVILFDRFYY